MKGRKGKNDTPKCEKPWIIQSSIITYTPYILIDIQLKTVEALRKYNYKRVDDECDKDTTSRFSNTDYQSTCNLNKSTNNFTEPSNKAESTKSLSDSEEYEDIKGVESITASSTPAGSHQSALNKCLD